MTSWSTRYADPPERRVWINQHPLRHGENECTVCFNSQPLFTFANFGLADRYRWWVIEREYKRLAALRERNNGEDNGQAGSRDQANRSSA